MGRSQKCGVVEEVARIKEPVQLSAALIHTRFPGSELRKAASDGPMIGYPSPRREIEMELTTPGFSVTQT